ncbi:MAG: AzlC family ABC transporter permease [Deltaproteobacteria bacterium]|jgi:predicted branched-subunit amino acid permease|nr:AzlC family ABC transporter permease [Deltaproteobacteria bacterium]
MSAQVNDSHLNSNERNVKEAYLPKPEDHGPETPYVSFQKSLKAGFLAGCPLLLGIVPFALIYGAAARDSGLTFFQTISMSLTVFAGSAQLIMVNLWAQKVTIPILALTCLALNLRLLIYGASLSLRLDPPTGPLEAVVRSYLLTDESYAVSMVGFYNPGFGYRRLAYYIGSGLPTWLGWQSVGIVGYLAGSIMPENRLISMAVPLIFLALLISILRASGSNRGPRLTSAIIAGLAAVALRDLPLNLGLLAAITLGVAGGLAADSIFRPKSQTRGQK